MSDKKTYRNLEEILKYLNKDLTGKERHELEREMESDPFIRDAVEGLDILSRNDIERDIKALRDRLRKRIKRRRHITIYSTAAAVASLLIVSSIFLKLHDFRPEEASERIAERAIMQESHGMVSDDEIPDTMAEEGEHSDEAELQPVAKDRITEKEDWQTVKKSEVAEVELVVKEPVIKREDTKTVPADGEKQADIVFVEAEAKAVEEKKRIETPVPRSSQSLFQPSAEEASSEKSAAVAGRVTLALDPDTEFLNEVVVTGYGTSETNSSETSAVKALRVADHHKDVSSSTPSPVSGIKDYRKYIGENIRFPEDAPDIDRAVVKLQITVGETGEIANIEVLQTGGESFTAEAIRLVREGPEWRPAVKDSINIEEHVLLRIVFKR